MTMIVDSSNLPDLVPLKHRVSLQHNGSDQVRIWSNEGLNLMCCVDSPTIHFHSDDQNTLIELRGCVKIAGQGNIARLVQFDFK